MQPSLQTKRCEMGICTARLKPQLSESRRAPLVSIARFWAFEE